MKKHIKNKKYLISVFLIAIAFLFKSFVSYAFSLDKNAKNGAIENNLPSSMQLLSLQDINTYDDFEVGKIYKINLKSNAIRGEFKADITPGARAKAALHLDTQGRNYLCIEKGVDAHWGGHYTRGIKYGETHEFTKLISYAKSKGWDDITIQALIWKSQDAITLDSVYQMKWNEYQRALENTPYADEFIGATVYEYSANSSSGYQLLIGYNYVPPISLTIHKWEEQQITDGNKETYAVNIARGLYTLDGTQIGIFKSRQDAQNKTNAYKIVTLNGVNHAIAENIRLENGKTYYLRELKSSPGYRINPQIYTFKADPNKTKDSVTIYNEAKNDPLEILLNKKGKINEKIPDAEFEISYYSEILSASQIKSKSPNKTWRFKTNEKGMVILDESLKIGGDSLFKNESGKPVGLIGTYTFKEVKAPEGYQLNPKVEIRQIEDDGNPSQLVHFENIPTIIDEPQYGKISIDKFDKETLQRLNGIEFDIKLIKRGNESNDWQEGSVVDTLKIGTKNESKDLYMGEYEITEKRSSILNRGYTIIKDPIKVTIKGDSSGEKYTANYSVNSHPNVSSSKFDENKLSISLNITNTPQKGQLTLNKKGNQLSGTKKETIEGYTVVRPVMSLLDLGQTKWELRAAEDIISMDGKTKLYSKGDLADTLTTTDSSKEDVKSKELPLGKYILKEVSAPSPFLTESDEGKESTIVEFTPQEPEIRLDLQSQRKVNERKNIKFRIEKEFEGSKYFTENPEALFGLYLKEDYSENKITIPKDTLLDVIRVKAKDGTTEVEDQAKQEKSFEIQEYKTVEVDDKSKPIYKGETLYIVTIKDTDGNSQRKEAHSQEEVDALIKEANDSGYDVEVETKDERKHIGYQKKQERQKDGDPIVVNTEEDKDDLINKLDAENKDYEVKEIPYQGEGKENQKVKINRIVEGEFRELPIDGKFYIKELSTDGNYVTDSDKITDFDFDSTDEKDNEKEVDKFTNRLIRVGINLIKLEEVNEKEESSEKIPVEGAVYKLVAVDDIKGESVVGHFTTDKDGKIEINDLEPGKYYLQEVSSPEGYFLNEDKIYFDLEGILPDVEDQTVKEAITEDEKKPEIATTATDQETGKKEHNPTEFVKIKDRVQYKDLVVNAKYKIIGRLMFKNYDEDGKVSEEPVKVNGNEVVKEVDFTATSRDGYYDVIFEVPGDVLRGKETVVFENLYRYDERTREYRMVALHNDIFDEGQTTRTVHPEIGTSLADVATDKKLINPISKIILRDKIYFKDLVVGEEYKLKLNLWNKATNDYVKDQDGNRLVVEKNFIPNVKTGTVYVEVEIDLSKFRGIDLVALEELYYKGEILAEHKDKEDKNQTVKVMNPKIKTKFATVDGKKEITTRLPIKLIDTVSFEDLVPGERYEISAIIMNKETNKPIVIDGKTAEVTLEFTTPEKSNQENGGVSGTIEVPITVNLGGYKGEDIVMFETLKYSGEMIAEHKDINDKDQTIKVKNHYALPTTGGTEVLGTIVLGLMTLIGMIKVSINKKRV